MNPDRRSSRKKLKKLSKVEIQKIDKLIDSSSIDSQQKKTFVEFSQKNPLSKLEIAKLQLQETSQRGQLTAGDMFVELASKDKFFEKQVEYLAIATNCWNNCLINSNNTSPESIKAATQLANLSNYESFIINRDIAKKENVEESYQKMINIARLTNDRILGIGKDNSNNEWALMTGRISEITTIALLQRFNLKSDQPEWTILPSFISEDTGNIYNRFQPKDSWDISIFNHYEETPTLTYKIQVKTNDIYEHNYCDDIAVVCTKSILGSIPLVDRNWSISELLYREASGDMTVTNRLDDVTDNLLEIIG